MFGFGGAVLIVTLVFGLIGIFLAVKGFLNLRQAAASKQWPSTTGRILSSEIRESSSTDNDGNTSTTYSADVAYE